MNKQEVYQFLQEKNIWFEVTEHKAVYNMEEVAEIEIPYPEADAKTLFIRDDKKKNYYLITVKGSKRVNLKEFRKQYQTRPLSFASEQELLLQIFNKRNFTAVDRTILVQKGGKNYVNIIGTYLSGRAGNGGNLSETEASEDHRNAHHRHCVGTVCVGFPGSFHSVNFCGPAENGIDHYTAESRIIAGFE